MPRRAVLAGINGRCLVRMRRRTLATFLRCTSVQIVHALDARRVGQAATMDDMSRGIFSRFKRGRAAKATASGPAPASGSTAAPPPAATDDGAEDEADDRALDLAFGAHFCCICGNPLGFDREDELDGEGPGRDICGPCNRTRNDDLIELGW
jgi:hypothetical protein